MAPYRILVVDDSAFMRKIISDLIIQDPQFTIVATAVNGQEAVEAVRVWKPDAITLDLEMPIMNGIEALQLIMSNRPTPVIMLSGISEDNTRETIKALHFGAFDFIRKPSSAISNDIHQVGEVLLEKLRFAVQTKQHQPIIKMEAESTTATDTVETKPAIVEHKIKQTLKPEEPPQAKVSSPVEDQKQLKPSAQSKKPEPRAASSLHKNQKEIKAEQAAPSKPKAVITPRRPAVRDSHSEPAGMKNSASSRKHIVSGASTTFRHIIALGTSTGGPRALHEVITTLPGDLPAPVLVVQHMPPKFTKSLAQRLDSFSALHVVEAEQGQRVSAGVVYIAPGGYHMELAKDASGYAILLTEQPQRNGHRPSVDVLFESLLAYRDLRRHVVIMTGMGSDGTKGMKQLADDGIESAIAEAEETCVVYGMPRAAIEAGCVNKILPLQHIASQLVQAVLK
ncbi:chemotaxis-specific protein-glutamate methyltransferase CheB [Paenibacillus sp. sgz302251]|uniref:protein-glutamate methylesterase/protein-glutamine glutaminase n=1 Tax=Paenibacillus sp. sgz302251 TaxID=3414493 RepID=UPI003C7CB625